MGIGHTELIVILIIVVILFGGSKIPELMKGLGKGIKEFKKAKDDVDGDDASKKDPPSASPKA